MIYFLNFSKIFGTSFTIIRPFKFERKVALLKIKICEIYEVMELNEEWLVGLQSIDMGFYMMT